MRYKIMKGRAMMHYWFGGKEDRRRAYAARRQRKAWWETAAEFHPNPSNFDPLGSYTGNPGSGGAPEQDADDL